MVLVVVSLMLGNFKILINIVVIKIVVDASIMVMLTNVKHVNSIGQGNFQNKQINIFAFVNRIITMIKPLKIVYV